MTDPSRIQAIRERHAKATPGEWHHRQAGEVNPVLGGGWDWIGDAPHGQPHKKIIVSRYSLYGGEPDYAFIAHAHQDIPWLLAELESAQSQAKEHAELMREVFERVVTESYETTSGGQCRWCNALIVSAHPNLPSENHTPDCIVTKLREAADRAEGGGDETNAQHIVRLQADLGEAVSLIDGLTGAADKLSAKTAELIKVTSGEIATLRARIATLTEWQPMESAPNCGNDVWVTWTTVNRKGDVEIRKPDGEYWRLGPMGAPNLWMPTNQPKSPALTIEPKE